MRARLLVGALAALWIAAPAQGAVTYTTGTEVSTNPSGSCFSTFFKTAFTKQDGADPKVGELFYVSLTATFIDSFDCAAEFVSSALTLPSGVVPAITADTPMICRRYGTNGSSQTVFDTRAQTNCPTSLSLSGGTYSVRPKANPVFPDIGGASGSYWTLGYPLREAQNYPNLQLLVPVKATSVLTSATVSHFSCAVSTGCLTSSVGGLNVGATTGGDGGGGGNGGSGGGGTGTATATTSLAGDLSVGAVGVALPISITSTQPFRILTDISTSSTLNGDVYQSGQPCGLPPGLVWPDPAMAPAYSVDGAFTWLLGEGYAPEPSDCFLSYNTLYYYRVCALNSAGTLVVTDSCRDSSFRTSAPPLSFDVPADTPAGRPTSTKMVVSAKILGPHFLGSLQMQARLAGFGGFQTVVKEGGGSTAQAYPEASTDYTAPSLTLTGVTGGSPFSFGAWDAYELRVCNAGSCSVPRKVIAGGMYDDQAESGVGETVATLSALPSSPRPAGSLTFHVGTSSTAQGKDLPLVATVALDADASTSPGTPITTSITGLSPSTTYSWSACFDKPGGFGVTGPEDCSTTRSFTTATPPAPPDTGTPSTGTPSTGTPSTGTPDTGTTTPLATVTGVTGGLLRAAPTTAQILKAAGGGAAQTAKAGGLTATLPKVLRRAKAKGRLLMGMVATTAGKAEVTLKKGARRRARGRFTVTAPGAFGFSLKLPKGIRAGKYSVGLAFTPKGTTKTSRVKVPLRLR